MEVEYQKTLEQAEERRRLSNASQFGFQENKKYQPKKVNQIIKKKPEPKIPEKKYIPSSEELELKKLKPLFKARPLPSKILDFKPELSSSCSKFESTKFSEFNLAT